MWEGESVRQSKPEWLIETKPPKEPGEEDAYLATRKPVHWGGPLRVVAPEKAS